MWYKFIAKKLLLSTFMCYGIQTSYNLKLNKGFTEWWRMFHLFCKLMFMMVLAPYCFGRYFWYHRGTYWFCLQGRRNYAVESYNTPVHHSHSPVMICEVVMLVTMLSVSTILYSISPQKIVIFIVTYHAVLCCLCRQSSTIRYIIHQSDNSPRANQPIIMFSLILKWIVLFKIMNCNAVA
jgi:hypothetical protein